MLSRGGAGAGELVLEADHPPGVGRPFSKQIHVALDDAFYQFTWLEPASIQAGPSSRDLAAFGQRFQHAFDVVIAVWRLLTSSCATHTVPDQEYAD